MSISLILRNNQEMLFFGTLLLFLVPASAFGAPKCPTVVPSADACKIEGAATAQSTNAEVSSALSFSFEPKYDCKRAKNSPAHPKAREFCPEEKPKEWTPEERAMVETATSNMMKNPKLRRVLLELAKKGPIKLFRMQQAVSLSDEQKKETLTNVSASYDSVRGGITILDYFFEEARKQNQICPILPFSAAAKKMERTLVHELAHAYAEAKGKLDYDCEFLKRSRWIQGGREDESVFRRG